MCFTCPSRMPTTRRRTIQDTSDVTAKISIEVESDAANGAATASAVAVAGAATVILLFGLVPTLEVYFASVGIPLPLPTRAQKIRLRAKTSWMRWVRLRQSLAMPP